MRTDSTRQRSPGTGKAGLVLVRRSEREFVPGRGATGESRRWLRDVCAAFGIDDQTTDAVALVATELLANAFLHAGTPSTVVLEVRSGCARIAVRDRCRVMPVMKAYDNELAATGRGLRIVAASATGWGVEPDVHGKTVWADVALRVSEEEPRHADGHAGPPHVGEVPGPSHQASRTSSSARDEGAGTAPRRGATAAESVTVWFCRVPVAPYLAMRARIDAILRESTLVLLGGGGGEIPQELLVLARRATTHFVALARAVASASTEAARIHDFGTFGDFTLAFPRSASSHLRGFGEVVHGLNGWCRSPHLLHAPLSPEMLELHWWSIDEALRQLEGSEPRPFSPIRPMCRPGRPRAAERDTSRAGVTRASG